ncbi:MAG TPA: bacterial transcriptional activator domain-containing protein, partial [Streptosporangiaceae bacterium]|nr:bacterial transcriptional activator domain-containing protein [Streptosporangiaceae bacterium]
HAAQHSRTAEASPTRRPAAAHSSANGSAVSDLLHPGRLTYPDELAAATLLAAGILAALGRRRREQLWQRAFGRRVVAPGREAALAESALRAGSDEQSARLLDRGLRYLSRAMAAAGRTPPAVVAAHLGHENLDLWVAPADLDAPAPWTAVGDGQVWRLPFTALAHLEVDDLDEALALFPGLVSIGTDHTGRVLVDLEAAHGVISVIGAQTVIISVLSAMAMELATSRWSDRMHITLAGFGDDLTALAPDRISTVNTLDEALTNLEAHAFDVAGAMAGAGVSSVLEGRSLAVNPDAWEPHYLISAVPPGPRDRSRLLALARIGGAAAAGYVVAGDVPGASWTWEVTPEGRLLAGTLGFDVQAQLIPVRQHEAVAGLFTAAARAEGVPLTPPDPHAVPPQQLEPGSEQPVGITILGPASVRAPGVLEPGRVPLVTELVVYLATHPGGVHPNVLTAALWPRGVADEIRDAAVARAIEWLGTDSIGRAHLAADASGRLRLGTGVRVDWQVFQALAGHAELAPAGSAEEADYLARALDLVQGLLLADRPPGRYAWLASDDLDYEVAARVADTAHRLATLRLATRDPEGAMDAARAGLRLAFDDELLWRDLLRAAHRTGREDLLRSVVDEVCARTARDETFLRMAPETESLIDELYPSWRSTVL